MTTIKKNFLLFSTVFFCLAACEQEEVITKDETSPFVAGNLATVKIAEDYEINFIEVEPGVIITATTRSIEAEEKAAPGILETLRSHDFVSTYKKLAGENVDLKSLKKLQGATLRYSEWLQKAKPDNTGLAVKTRTDDSAGNAGARVMACSGGSTGSKWFEDNMCKRTAGNIPGQLVTPYYLNKNYLSEFASGGNIVQWEVDIMNGQANNSGNKIRIQWNNEWSMLLDDWKVTTLTILPSQGATITVSFPTGLTCLSSHMAFHVFNPGQF